MKYYVDDMGDLWKVDHFNEEYWTAEMDAGDRHFKKSTYGWKDMYLHLHGMVEITEDKAEEMLEGNRFLLDI